MTESGVHFYASLQFPNADARAAWLARPIDPRDERATQLLEPLRSIWNGEVRTELFGGSVGLARSTDDEATARAALSHLIGDARVTRVETAPDEGGSTRYTFYLAGRLAPGHRCARCATSGGRDGGDGHLVREGRLGARTDVMAWLDGTDGFDEFVEVLSLIALGAHGLASSAAGFFVPTGDTNPDLGDFGEFSWEEGGAPTFGVGDIQSLGEETDARIKEAWPSLVATVGPAD